MAKKTAPENDAPTTNRRDVLKDATGLSAFIVTLAASLGVDVAQVLAQVQQPAPGVQPQAAPVPRVAPDVQPPVAPSVQQKFLPPSVQQKFTPPDIKGEELPPSAQHKVVPPTQ